MPKIKYKVGGDGHRKQRGLLTMLLERGDIGHAFIFYGPRQVGKSLIASQFIKSLLCSHSESKPCGKCDQCSSIDAGRHPDVYTIRKTDGFDSIRIEQIRDFNHQLRLKPVLSSRKIGVIYDAEDLTVVSANALLKLLEDAPPSALLLLVCNNISMVPSTVLSRCMLLKFDSLSRLEMEKLMKAYPVENKDKHDTVMKVALGRSVLAKELMNNGLSEYSRTMQQVFELLGGQGIERLMYIDSLIKDLRKSDPDRKISEIAATTVHILGYIELALRDILFMKINKKLVANVMYIDTLTKLSQVFSITKARTLIEAVAELRSSLVRHLNVQLAWENFLIKVS